LKEGVTTLGIKWLQLLAYKRRGGGAPRGLPISPSLLLPPPSSTSPLHRLGEALQEFLHHHHHTVVLLGFPEDLLHPLPRWNGERTSSTTVRVPEYGGAARLQRRKDRPRDLEIGK